MTEDEVIVGLRELLSAQPGLAQPLRTARDGRAAATYLARLGAMNGIATNPAEILGFVARLMPAPGREALDDAQLDAVVGGRAEHGEAWCDALRRALL